MKKGLVILSDLWGKRDSNWWSFFGQELSNEFDITFYDSCELGGIDLTNSDTESIHGQFVDFGIENAVNKLLELEKRPKIFIGCSVGGVIAWKAGLKGLKIQNLVTLSSTRLRKETDKPNCSILMYFGEFDQNKPSFEWFNKMDCKHEIIKDGHHDIYKDELIVASMLEKIIEYK